MNEAKNAKTKRNLTKTIAIELISSKKETPTVKLLEISERLKNFAQTPQKKIVNRVSKSTETPQQFCRNSTKILGNPSKILGNSLKIFVS